MALLQYWIDWDNAGLSKGDMKFVMIFCTFVLSMICAMIGVQVADGNAHRMSALVPVLRCRFLLPPLTTANTRRT